MIPDAIYYMVDKSESKPAALNSRVRASQRNIRPCAVAPAQYLPFGSTVMAVSFSGSTIFSASWSYCVCVLSVSSACGIRRTHFLKVIHIHDRLVLLGCEHEAALAVPRLHRRGAVCARRCLLPCCKRGARLYIMERERPRPRTRSRGDGSA